MNKENIKNVIGDWKKFLDKCFLLLQEKGVYYENFVLDHICLRVETAEQYNEYKEKILDFGKLLKENKIRGREIAVFELFIPLIYKNQLVKYLELPMPSQHHSYKFGLQHCEFVLDILVDDFVAFYPSLEFKIDQPGGRLDREIKILGEDDLVVKLCEHGIGVELSGVSGATGTEAI